MSLGDGWSTPVHQELVGAPCPLQRTTGAIGPEGSTSGVSGCGCRGLGEWGYAEGRWVRQGNGGVSWARLPTTWAPWEGINISNLPNF